MLEIIDATVSYGMNTPISNMSFCLEQGKVGCIVGYSGVGKTTLAKAISGVLPVSQGEIKLDGIRLQPSTHKIGYAAQDYSLYPWKTVKENIMLGIKIKKIKLDNIFFDEVVDALGVRPLLLLYPNNISGGEKQRVALARSFLISPDLLVMDEPFSALDEITREETSRFFVSLQKKYKPTTLLITHSIEEAVKISNQIFIQRKDGMETVAMKEHDADMKNYILGRLAK